MNNLLVRDVKYLDEQYRIGEGLISDGAFKQLEKLFIPVDPEPNFFNQKNNKLLPKLAKDNYEEFLGSLLTKTRLSIQPKIDGCAIAIRYINGNFNKAITKKGFDVTSKIKQIKMSPIVFLSNEIFKLEVNYTLKTKLPEFPKELQENMSMIRKGLEKISAFAVSKYLMEDLINMKPLTILKNVASAHLTVTSQIIQAKSKYIKKIG